MEAVFTKKFKESTIPEDASKMLAQQAVLLGPPNVYKIATVLFTGVSNCLGSIKNKSIPKAVVFKSIDNSFIAAAKVEYIGNEDDPTNPAAGRWDYTWTFYEDDIKGADVVDVAMNSLASTYFVTAASNLYNIKFAAQDICILLMITIMEMIKKWLIDNTTPNQPSASLSLDGVFEAVSSIGDNGKIELGLIPAGEMKVLIKDDSAIQEA